MTTHRYPGLFGDPRQRGLAKAVVVSLVLHVGLFLGFARFQIRPPQRTFYAPIQVVNLVDRPGPARAGKGRAPAAASRPARPKAAPKAKPVKAPKPKPEVKTGAKAKPAARARPKPAKKPAAAAPARAKPAPAPSPARPVSEADLEQKVAERIAALRRKHGPEEAPAGPTPAEPAALGRLGESRVSQAVEAIRRRIDEASARGPGGSGAAGLSGTRSTLQEVRLRAYYNRLWEHVNSHWGIPPGLKGRGLSVILSVVIDRNGRILRRVVEESSGSPPFDESALRALERAQPLPPIPDEVPDDTLEVGFRFHGE